MAVLCVVAFCLGSAETMFDNASQAILPSVVERSSLELANSRLQSVEIITRDFVGPPFGALLFGVATLTPFALDSASFGVAAVLVLTLTGSFRVERSGPPTRIRTDIAEGLRWLWRHRLIRTLAIMLAVWNLVSAASMAVLVLFALEELGTTRTGYGLLFTAWAVGGLLGSLVATRVIARLGHARSLITAVMVGALSYTGMIFVTNPFVAGGLFLMEGVVVVIWNVITVSARQALVPAELFGRVNSVYRFVGWGVLPIGALLGGVVARAFGLRAPFVIAAVTLVVLVLWARRIVTRAAFDHGLRGGPPGRRRHAGDPRRERRPATVTIRHAPDPVAPHHRNGGSLLPDPTCARRDTHTTETVAPCYPTRPTPDPITPHHRNGGSLLSRQSVRKFSQYRLGRGPRWPWYFEPTSAEP